jgi:hypothetical protein
VSSAGFVPGVTFGHFRAAVKDAAGSNRSSIIRKRLELATVENPRGVILFSTRSTDRIDELLAILRRVDRITA